MSQTCDIAVKVFYCFIFLEECSGNVGLCRELVSESELAPERVNGTMNPPLLQLAASLSLVQCCPPNFAKFAKLAILSWPTIHCPTLMALLA